MLCWAMWSMRLVQPADHLDAQNQAQPLLVEVVWAGWLDVPPGASRGTVKNQRCGWIGPQLHRISRQPVGHLGEEINCDVAMHEDRVERIAHGGPLGLGVVDDLDGLGLVSRGVHVQVANADPAGHNGDRGLLAAELVQAHCHRAG